MDTAYGVRKVPAILRWIGAAVLMWSVSAGPFAGGLGDVYRRVARTVVEIWPPPPSGTAAGGSGAADRQPLGSGVLVGGPGLVVTAAHVVADFEDVEIMLAGGERRLAKVERVEGLADVASLKVRDLPPEYAPAELGDSDALSVGDEVFVVGAPYGMRSTLTAGHVSARRVSRAAYGSLSPFVLLQTDAAINAGNSGGPLFDGQGRVMGVVSYIVTESGGSQGLGFVIPSSGFRRLLLERPGFWDGVDFYRLEGDLAGALNVPGDKGGLLVQRVEEGSLGARAGLRGGNIPATLQDDEVWLGGDVLLAVQGIAVGPAENVPRIERALAGIPASGEVTVTVLRAGAVREFRIRPNGPER